MKEKTVDLSLFELLEKLNVKDDIFVLSKDKVLRFAKSDLVKSKNITTDYFAKYVLLHSFAASKCKIGSNASAIGDELSKLVRNIKTRQIS